MHPNIQQINREAEAPEWFTTQMTSDAVASSPTPQELGAGPDKDSGRYDPWVEEALKQSKPPF